MPEVCTKCGLPKEICACGVMEREAQKISIFVEKRKFGKPITVVKGITDRAKEVTSELKAKLACGGTFKNNHIELQGDHRNRLKDVLIKLGYSEGQIELS